MIGDQVSQGGAFYYCIANNTNSSPPSANWALSASGTGANGGDRTKIAAAITANPAIFVGWSPIYNWHFIQPTAAGQYPGFYAMLADFNAWQTASPGAYFVPQVSAYRVANGTFNPNGGASIIPAYILSGGSSYGNTPVGGSGNGWMATGYSAPNYTYYEARLDNALVNAEWLKLFAYIMNTPFVTTAGPYAGQTFTLNTHPLCAGYLDWTGVDVATLGPSQPSDYTVANWFIGCKSIANAFVTNAANTLGAMMTGYGGAPSEPVADQLTLLNLLKATGSAANSCTDVVYSGSVFKPAWAQDYFIGNTTSDGGNTWTAGGTDFRPLLAQLIVAQGLDYSYQSSIPYTAAQVAGLLTSAFNTLKGHHYILAIDDNRFANSWTGSNSYGANGIYGAIVAGMSGITIPYVLPLNMMFAIPVASASTTTSSCTLNFQTFSTTPGAATYQGSGLNIKIFDGVTLVGTVAGTAGTFTHSGLTAGSVHTYTLKMSNANGDGVAGPPITLVPGRTAIVGQAFSSQLPNPGSGVAPFTFEIDAYTVGQASNAWLSVNEFVCSSTGLLTSLVPPTTNETASIAIITGDSAYTITNVSNGNPSVITINAGGGTNPFASASYIAVQGVGSYMHDGCYNIVAVGGSSGAWTISCGTAFVTYTGGGKCGIGTRTVYPLPVIGVEITTPEGFPPAQQSTVYSLASPLTTMAATNGSGSYSWSGTAVNGLSVDSASGKIIGTPSTLGSFSLPITCTDTGTGATVSSTYYVTVVPATTATRPAGNTGSGLFVRYGQLYDRNGKFFRPRGMNRTHYNSNPQNGFLSSGANIARVFTGGNVAAATIASEALTDHINHGEVPIITMASFVDGSATTGQSNTTEFNTLISFLAIERLGFQFDHERHHLEHCERMGTC